MLPCPSRLGMHRPGARGIPPVLRKQQHASASLPLWPVLVVLGGSSSGEAKPRAPLKPQKSATPGTAVIAPVISHSVGAVTSSPSAMGLIAPPHASVAATAPAHPIEGVPADQLSLLAPPVVCSLTFPLACCSLPPSSSPLPHSGPSSDVLRSSLPFLANMKSSLLNRNIAKQYLAREVLLGRVAGPFTSSPFASLLHTN